MTFSAYLTQGVDRVPLSQPPIDDRPSIAQSGGFSADGIDRQLNSEDSGISEKFVDSIRGLSPILRQNVINLALGKPQKRSSEVTA